MSHNVKIIGADRKAANTGSGGNAGKWTPSLQVASADAYGYKLIVFVPTAIGANRVVWLFDLAAGVAGTNTNPETVLVCPAGFTTTLDLNGKLFFNGIYLEVATNEPPDAATAPTTGALNDARITLDYRLR